MRQVNGSHEIDLLLQAPDGRVVAIEVKATSTPSGNDAKHLVWLREQLSDRIHALPIATIWDREN